MWRTVADTVSPFLLPGDRSRRWWSSVVTRPKRAVFGRRPRQVAADTTGDQILEAFPAIVENTRASRAFLARAVEYLADDASIREFLNIGTGLGSNPATCDAHTRLSA